MILLAHHLEPHHFPILACFLAAGFWIGWNLMSRLVRSREAANSYHAEERARSRPAE